ncbi:hypothetical protein QVD17_35178 [Tagetes erecta]|uniref:Uncharacterized protein n=1 Tax=Tagetes erecta TaxID=13708 RepID=A0AAD8JYX8_TARER|nr:hypothetical protein QVD17_35178 [Tagetes erecta]
MVDVFVGCINKFLAKIGRRLIVKTRRYLGYVLYDNNYIKSLKEQLKKFEVKRKGVSLEPDEATRNEESVEPRVNEWQHRFTNVDIISEESTKFLEDEVPTNKHILKGWFPNIKRLYMSSKKAKKTIEKIDTLTNENIPKISYGTPPLAIGHKSTINFRNFESRIPTINRLIKWLEDDSENIISICGMGGSGKNNNGVGSCNTCKREKSV